VSDVDNIRPHAVHFNQLLQQYEQPTFIGKRDLRITARHCGENVVPERSAPTMYSSCDCMTYISDSVFAAHSTQWMWLLRRDTIGHAIYSLGVTFNLWRSPAFDDSAR
jgi:hypothetical protein